MNTLVIVLIAAVILFGAYMVYGRWLANKWGIDPKAETPAVKYNDGKDFVPTNGWTVFSHQFSSIAGAGPVTGAIQAAAFGWLPVLLWILIGGVFFGAVTDFGALYASVKNEGKSMGMIIEKYIGKFGRKIFLLFCWLFTLIVIAAFADMVAGTFNAYTVVDGASQLAPAASTNGSAGTVSIMFMVFAVVFGLIQKKFNLSGWKEAVVGIAFIAIEMRNHKVRPSIVKFTQLSYKTAFIIGVFQLLALIPGTSRSGITIIGGMLFGCSRFIAAEYTFYLAIPVMFGASGLKLVKFLVKGGGFSPEQFFVVLLASIVSYGVSMIVIKFLMQYIKRHNFNSFALYRIALGIIVLIVGFAVGL